MTVYIASDHAGFELKEKILSLNPSFKNLGPDSEDRVDYPDFAKKVCSQIAENNESFGILICGSGQGMSISANKFPQIRAALCTSLELAELSRAHNNANVLCLSSRLVEEKLNLKILKRFFATDFEGGRHQQRVDKIKT